MLGEERVMLVRGVGGWVGSEAGDKNGRYHEPGYFYDIGI